MDLWELFEATRGTFSAGMRELLPVRERLALPTKKWGEGAIFVSSDAPRRVIGAIDWTNGLIARKVMRWSSMSPRCCLSSKAGEMWRGKAVLYGGDNKIVREWIEGRKSGTVVGRLLVRDEVQVPDTRSMVENLPQHPCRLCHTLFGVGVRGPREGEGLDPCGSGGRTETSHGRLREVRAVHPSLRRRRSLRTDEAQGAEATTTSSELEKDPGSSGRSSAWWRLPETISRAM